MSTPKRRQGRRGGEVNVTKCCRCRKRMRRTDGWNADFKAGIVVGYLCPSCQSPKENAEAQINESTIDYSTGAVDQFGRLWAKPKVTS